jgi:hypothetical protein
MEGVLLPFGEARPDCKQDLIFIYTYSHCISDLLSCILAADTLTALSILFQTKPSEMSLSSSVSCEAPESEQMSVLGQTDLSDFAAAVDAAFHLGKESPSDAPRPTVEFIFEAFVAKQNGAKQKCVEPVACTAVGKEHTTVFDRLELEQIEERKRKGHQNRSDAVYLDSETKTSLAAVCKEVAPAFKWDLSKYTDFCDRHKEWIEAAKDAEYELIDDFSSSGDEGTMSAYESSSVCSAITVDSRS